MYDAREGLGIAASVEDAVDAVRWAGTPAAAAAEAAAAAALTPPTTTAGEASIALPPPSHSHGGDPTRLAVLGHSAGAHLAVAAAMILAAEGDKEEEEMEKKEGGGREKSCRKHSLPSAVVSLAGPFDLPSHFEHEGGRGVHRLSTMARAAATPRSFALEAAERSKGRRVKDGSSSNATGASSSFFDAAPELHRASLAALSPLACLDPGASLAGLRPASGPLHGVAAAAAVAEEEEARKGGRRGKNQREQQKTRYLFLSSAADAVVPPTSSRAIHAALARRQEGSGRVESRHVEYSDLSDGRPVGHADFVVRSWRIGEEGGSSAAEAAPWAAEVEAVVSSL